MGQYPITFAGAVDNAYRFVYVNTGFLSIIKAPQQLSGFNSQAQIRPGETITLTGSSTSGLPLTVSILDPNIATATGLSIAAITEGATTIAIYQAGNINYLPSETVFIRLVSTTVGVVSGNAFAIIGKSTVGAGSYETYKIPQKPGYTYQWAYSGEGVVFTNTIGSEIEIYFTDNATFGSITADIFNADGNLVKRDFIMITVNSSPIANQGKDLKEVDCAALIADCQENYINSVSIGKLSNFDSGCSNGGYGDFTSLGKIDTLKTDHNYTLRMAGASSTNEKFYFAAWIDYNNNGNFNDADDFINYSFEAVTAFEIPNIIIRNRKEYDGNRRMRVAMRTSGRLSKDDFCLAENEKGETEDYLIFIKGQDALEASSVITPNEDGKNDIFLIKGIDAKTDNKLTILDRWGASRFETANYSNNWYGLDKSGKPLDDGTYFYFFHNGERQIKGFVEIRRD